MLTKYLRSPRMWAIIISAIVILCVMLIPVSVGDGGSKYRMLERTGLVYSSQPQGGLAQTSYGVESTDKFSFANIHELLISCTNVIKAGYNTSVLCIIYAILFLLGMFLFIGSSEDKSQPWHKWVTSIASLLILSDLAYTAYFNSLYSQPLFMVLFVLFCGISMCALRSEMKLIYAIGLILCGAAISAIDTVTAVIAVILGAAIILINIKSSKKLISVITGAAVMLCGFAFILNGSSPDYEKNLYNAVFQGVANFDSVQELGLDKELDSLKGQYYSEDTVQEYNLTEALYSKIGYRDIAAYYISHPKALLGALSSEASNCFRIQAEYEGNFTGTPGKLASGFNLYSYIKGKFFPNTMMFILMFFVIYFALVIFLLLKGKEHRKPLMAAMLMLGICGVISFVLPYMRTGIVEMHHSMFYFYLIFDMMLLSSVIGGSYILKERNLETKEKYGVNQ